MKRKDALRLLQFAGYHNDTSSYIRIYVENRISKGAADKAFNQGRSMKANGMKCNCYHCTKGA